MNGYTETEGNKAAYGPTRQVRVESSESNSEDGLLKLELIGYANAIESFNELTVVEAGSKISAGEEFLLFVGRPTCE